MSLGFNSKFLQDSTRLILQKFSIPILQNLANIFYANWFSLLKNVCFFNALSLLFHYFSFSSVRKLCSKIFCEANLDCYNIDPLTWLRLFYSWIIRTMNNHQRILNSIGEVQRTSAFQWANAFFSFLISSQHSNHVVVESDPIWGNSL